MFQSKKHTKRSRSIAELDSDVINKMVKNSQGNGYVSSAQKDLKCQKKEFMSTHVSSLNPKDGKQKILHHESRIRELEKQIRVLNAKHKTDISSLQNIITAKEEEIERFKNSNMSLRSQIMKTKLNLSESSQQLREAKTKMSHYNLQKHNERVKRNEFNMQETQSAFLTLEEKHSDTETSHSSSKPLPEKFVDCIRILNTVEASLNKLLQKYKTAHSHYVENFEKDPNNLLNEELKKQHSQFLNEINTLAWDINSEMRTFSRRYNDIHNYLLENKKAVKLSKNLFDFEGQKTASNNTQYYNSVESLNEKIMTAENGKELRRHCDDISTGIVTQNTQKQSYSQSLLKDSPKKCINVSYQQSKSYKACEKCLEFIQRLQLKNADLSNENVMYMTQLQKNQDEYQTMRCKFEDAQEKCYQLEQIKEYVKLTLAKQDEELVNLKQKLKSEIDVNKVGVNLSSHEISRNEMTEKLYVRLNELQKSYDKQHENELSSRQYDDEIIQHLEMHISQLRYENTTYLLHLYQMMTELNLAHKKLQLMQERYQQLTQNLSDEAHKNTELLQKFDSYVKMKDQELASLKMDLEKVNNDNTCLSLESARNNQITTELQLKLDKSKRSHNTQKKQYKVMIQNLESQITQLSNKKSDRLSQFDQILNERNMAQEELQHTQEYSRQLAQNFNDEIQKSTELQQQLKSQVQMKDQELINLKAQSEKERKTKKRRLISFKQEAALSKQKLEQLQLRLNELQESYDKQLKYHETELFFKQNDKTAIQISQLNNENSASLSQLDKVRLECNAVQEKLQHSQEHYRQLAQYLSDKTQQNTDLQQQFESQVKMKDQELVSLKRQIEKENKVNKQKLQMLEDEAARRSQASQQLQLRLSELQESYDKQKNQYEKELSSTQNDKVTIQYLQSQVSQLSDEKSACLLQLNRVTSECNAVQEKLQHSQEHCRQLAQNLSDKTQQNTDLQQQFESQVKMKDQELVSLKRQIEKENKVNKQKLQMLEDEAARRSQASQQLQLRLSELQESYDKQKNQHEKELSSTQNDKVTIQYLQSQVSQLSDEKSACLLQLNRVTSKCNAVQEKLQHSQEHCRQLAQNLSDKTQQNTDLQQQFESQVKMKDQELVSLKRQIEKENKVNKQKLQMLEDETARQNQTSQQLQIRLSELQESFDRQKSQYEKELSSARNDKVTIQHLELQVSRLSIENSNCLMQSDEKKKDNKSLNKCESSTSLSELLLEKDQEINSLRER